MVLHHQSFFLRKRLSTVNRICKLSTLIKVLCPYEEISLEDVEA